MKHIKLTYFILAMLIVSMQWSCSKDDDLTENKVEQSIDLSKYEGLTRVQIDGKTVNSIDDLEATIKNAFSVHFDYVNENLVILTTQVEGQKYLDADPRVKAQIDKSLKEQETKPFLLNTTMYDEFNGKINHNNDHDYGIIDNHARTGFFLFHKSNVNWIEGLASVRNTANTTTFHYMSEWRALRNLNNSFKMRFDVAVQYGYQMTIRNSSDTANKTIIFYDDIEFRSAAGYKIISIGANQDYVIPTRIYKVDGVNTAGSILVL